MAEIFASRYVAQPPNVEQLLQLSEDSLGHAYATYLKTSGFEADFYRPLEVEDDVTYFLLRMRQTHDIWHLVAGFSTDVPGELGLKAFELAQTRRPLSAVLLSGGVLSAVFKSALLNYGMNLPPSPQFWGSRISQSPPELGDLGGKSANNSDRFIFRFSNAFKSPTTLGPLLEQIAIGYRLSATAQPLLAQRWEDHWGRSLEDWRSRLNLQPVSHYSP